MPSGYLAIPIEERPLCPVCKTNVRPLKKWTKKGNPVFCGKCHVCAGYVKSKNKPMKAAIQRKQKNMTCEKCGFKAEHTCQLDIDHIDGNNSNNDPANHQVLCANCHRLKTIRNKDWKSSKEGAKIIKPSEHRTLKKE